MLYISLAAQSLFALSRINNHYEINSAQDLAEFASLVNKGDITVNAVLKHDIDYRGYEEMIGYDSACYCGTFDGTCHKILISIDDEDAGLALFRFVGKGGTIKNLHVEGEIHAHRERAGGIVGHMTDGTVSNCFCKVDIISDHSGQCHYGGIVGRTEGKTLIINSVYNGHIIAPDGSDIGGLVGWVGSPGTTLRNSLASCDVVLRTLEGSNSVVRAENSDYVKCQNIYYLNELGSAIEGTVRITPEQQTSGEVFYRIFGGEFYSEERQSEKKINIYQNTMAYIGLGFICIVMVTATAIVVLYYYKERQRAYKQLYEKALVAHETWLNEQKKIIKSQSKVNREKLSAADSVPENEMELSTDKQIEVEPKSGNRQDENKPQDNLKTLYAQLLITMEEKRLYRDPYLDEPAVAQAVCSNKSYISECISRYSDQSNFSTWLAFYRINHAIQMIEENPNTDVKTLYVESGFNNHTSFTRHFKNIIGMTATQYIKIMKEKTQL